MITPGQLFRIISIQRTLIRHGFDEIILTTPLLRSVRFILYLLPWNWWKNEQRPQSERIRVVLEELGPLFIKLGQLLSTRRDFLPDDIAEELAKLQDKVPPFPGEQARDIIEKALGESVTTAFAAFEVQPLASASIAQVHAARLHDGREVIVKVVRPNIERIIKRDIGLMQILASAAERYTPQGKQLKPTRVIAEFEKTLIDELDMMREAANATQLRRNFADSKRMSVPDVFWQHTRRNVLVMERVRGIQINDIDGLTAAGIDLTELAECGIEIFFTQIFRDHFFHADVHPGNLFVVPDEQGGLPQFVPVDFGIMGSLSEFDQHYLAENFYAFLNRDYRRVAELHVESGWVPRDTRVDDFEFAIRTVCEPIFDRPVKDISIGSLLLRLFQTAKRFHMEILPQLLLLQKTLVNIEGIGRQLSPDLDLWKAARPSLEAWMRDRVGVRSFMRSIKQNAPQWADRLPELPGLIFDVFDQMKSGRLQIATADPQIDALRREIQVLHKRLVYAVVGIGLVIGAIVLYGVESPTGKLLGPLPIGVWALAAIGIGAIFAAFRWRGS